MIVLGNAAEQEAGFAGYDEAEAFVEGYGAGISYVDGEPEGLMAAFLGDSDGFEHQGGPYSFALGL